MRTGKITSYPMYKFWPCVINIAAVQQSDSLVIILSVLNVRLIRTMSPAECRALGSHLHGECSLFARPAAM
jgi:hypothetical protein